MERRKLEELNLVDNFLIGEMTTHPLVGEPFVRALLKIIFRREFGEIEIAAQKIYYGNDTDKHGVQLDIFVEEIDEDAGKTTVYDIEPDNRNKIEDKASLPRRARFYHSKIDGDALKSGTEYSALKRVSVVFITTYDPFGLNRMIYTIQSKCLEVPEMSYDDGVTTLFLYTKGKEGNPPQELVESLHYMEYTTKDNAVNETLKGIQQLVDQVKHDKEVSLRYMKLMEEKEILIQQIRAEERVNLERERKRADDAEKELKILQEKLKSLEERIKQDK
jgi:hypothetical protein